jgi:glycosyltransferase involved in cell wall biosynthesis
MMRVLMIVQELNEGNWLRGFIVGWVRALAKQVEHVHVLTLERGQADLPENVSVQSMGKEYGYNRLRELRLFYRGVGWVIQDVDAIFSHMTPRYTWLAAPYALAYGKPQMLWFTHRKDSLELRLAVACARWITTASPDSFPIQSPKVHVMGHGIDTERFSPAPEPIISAEPPLVLAVGRITPIKNHHLLLEAATHLPREAARFAIVGDVAAQGDEDYRQSLLQRRDALGLSPDQFQLLGGLETDGLIKHYREAAIVINLSPAGLFDKAALEAMLVGVPLLATNAAFKDLWGEHQALLQVPEDASQITAGIQKVLALSTEQRTAIGADLRRRTAEAHGLDRLMQKMVKLMQSKSGTGS